MNVPSNGRPKARPLHSLQACSLHDSAALRRPDLTVAGIRRRILEPHLASNYED